MAERKRSSDGTRETEELFGAPAAISGVGRSGGRPARDVATRDELKRTYERPAGATRVRGEQDEGPKK